MNRPFAEQGVAAESASVVYAVNTLHAAHDLGFTLGEARGALEPGGSSSSRSASAPGPATPSTRNSCST